MRKKGKERQWWRGECQTFWRSEFPSGRTVRQLGDRVIIVVSAQHSPWVSVSLRYSKIQYNSIRCKRVENKGHTRTRTRTRGMTTTRSTASTSTSTRVRTKGRRTRTGGVADNMNRSACVPLWLWAPSCAEHYRVLMHRVYGKIYEQEGKTVRRSYSESHTHIHTHTVTHINICVRENVLKNKTEWKNIKFCG